MKSEWKEYTLGELVDVVIDYRGKTPKKLGGDWSPTGYRALSAKNIKTGSIVQPDSIRHVDENLYRKWMKTEINRGDILITSEAPFGQIYYWDCEEKIVLSQRLFGIRIKKDFDSKFIYHYMTTALFFGEMQARATGTTVIGLRQPELLKCKICCPPYEQQIKIAQILSSLDSKIEINNKIITNLEEQAQAIFSNWSQKYINTHLVTLNDVCLKITDGSHFSPQNETSSRIPMLSVKDMKKYDFDFSNCKHISTEDFTNMLKNDCVPQKDDILIAKDGSYLKEIFICNKKRDLTILSSIAIFRPNVNIIYPEILLYLLKSPSILQTVRDHYVSGSALPRIVLKDFKKLEFYLPNLSIQQKIVPILSSIRRQIYILVEENRHLSALRDTLLPKLMSGELDVSELDL